MANGQVDEFVLKRLKSHPQQKEVDLLVMKDDRDVISRVAHNTPMKTGALTHP